MSKSDVLVYKLGKVYPTLGYIDLVVTFSNTGPALFQHFEKRCANVIKFLVFGPRLLLIGTFENRCFHVRSK